MTRNAVFGKHVLTTRPGAPRGAKIFACGTNFAGGRGAVSTQDGSEDKVMPSNADLHIGKRLFRRRRLLGLTQKAVADKIGVKFQQIQKYECGGSTIAACRVWQLAEALEVSVNYFYDDLPGEPLDHAPLGSGIGLNNARLPLGANGEPYAAAAA
jgi:transcriptional regulator with XRE-family HTH domain